jgi:protein TonB
MLRATAGARPALAAEPLVALLFPPKERPRHGRWLLVAAAVHAAAIALLLATPERPAAPEQIVRVHLLPGVEEPGSGPPAAAALPEPPAPALAPPRPAPPPRVAKPAPTPKPERPVVAPVPAPRAARAPDAVSPEAAPIEDGTGAGEAGAAESGPAHASTNGSIGASRNGNGNGSGGLAGLDPAYVRRFLASLDRHKQYPRAARARRLEGTTLLWMRMDRSGQVLASRVQRSSGHSVLDRAVLQAVQDANPLPALPASDARAQVELEVPIAFRMR